MRKLLKENYRNLPEREKQEQRERTPEGGSQNAKIRTEKMRKTYQKEAAAGEKEEKGKKKEEKTHQITKNVKIRMKESRRNRREKVQEAERVGEGRRQRRGEETHQKAQKVKI